MAPIASWSPPAIRCSRPASSPSRSGMSASCRPAIAPGPSSGGRWSRLSESNRRPVHYECFCPPYRAVPRSAFGQVVTGSSLPRNGRALACIATRTATKPVAPAPLLRLGPPHARERIRRPLGTHPHDRNENPMNFIPGKHSDSTGDWPGIEDPASCWPDASLRTWQASRCGNLPRGEAPGRPGRRCPPESGQDGGAAAAAPAAQRPDRRGRC
jgi:hypothetical protein